MSTINITDYLPLVRRPSRYIGGEVNSVKKDPCGVRLTFGLAFPDTYEVGMSHLGLQILYQILNSRQHIACERVFAPWSDMEALLREKGLPLTTLESKISGTSIYWAFPSSMNFLIRTCLTCSSSGASPFLPVTEPTTTPLS
jgi:hypothetical protein